VLPDPLNGLPGRHVGRSFQQVEKNLEIQSKGFGGIFTETTNNFNPAGTSLPAG